MLAVGKWTGLVGDVQSASSTRRWKWRDLAGVENGHCPLVSGVRVLCERVPAFVGHICLSGGRLLGGRHWGEVVCAVFVRA